MKIPEIGPGEIPQLKKPAKARPAELTSAVAPRDTVEVGTDALLVSRLRAKLIESAAPNPRVAELQQQVANGTYEPDPGELARILFGLEPAY